MNASGLRQGTRLVASAVIVGGIFASCAFAQDSRQQLASVWSDPLRTLPPQFVTGKTLPGDGSPVACPSILAQQFSVGDTPLSLGEAIDLALCFNPQVKDAWAGIKIQAAAAGEARAAYFPVVTAGVNRLNDQNHYPGTSVPSNAVTSNTLSANLNWRLFDFGGRDANRRSANDLLDAALANHDAVMQKILTGVIAAYFDAQTAQAALAADQENEQLTQLTLDSAQRKEARGAGARSDTLQSATAQAKASLERSRAQGAANKAMALLVYALGIPDGSHLVLEHDLSDSSDSIKQELAEWLAQAQAQHPALVAARAQLESAKEKVIAARSEGLPTIDASAGFYQNGRPNQGLATIRTRETLVGISINIPIFDGFLNSYKVRGAQAQVEHSEAAMEDVEYQVLRDVVTAYSDASAALDNMAASQKLLEAATAALETVRRKFDRGAADILDVINTQAALANARQERLHSLADWRSGRLRLMAAAGLLGRDEVSKR